MGTNDSMVWAEMARRKKFFHRNTKWSDITLWGLFNWGMVSLLIKNGELITDMKKENKIVWVRPTKKTWKTKIKPLLTISLKELERMAGW
jgi:hypothetical protein